MAEPLHPVVRLLPVPHYHVTSVSQYEPGTPRVVIGSRNTIERVEIDNTHRFLYRPPLTVPYSTNSMLPHRTLRFGLSAHVCAFDIKKITDVLSFAITFIATGMAHDVQICGGGVVCHAASVV